MFEPGGRNQLVPYRFGTLSADFMFCRKCGVVVTAIAKIDHVDRAVLNVRTLDLPEEGDQPFVLEESEGCFDGEDLEQRTSRRRDRWIGQVNWRKAEVD